MLRKLKKFSFLLFTFFGLSFWQIFALEIQLPWDKAGDDLAIRIESESETKQERWWEVKKSQWSTRISGDKNTIYNFINMINEYLRWIFGAIAMGLTIYAGYEAITAGGDQKALKKAMRILIWTAVGITIAMLSVALVKILVNLNI